MYSWFVALLVAAIGHAAWDNVLHWMVVNDPDASIFHMHWLRSLFLTMCLWVFRTSQVRPSKSIRWWIQFSLLGFTIPTLLYTSCVAWTGYRIILGGQPFIPLLVVWSTQQEWDVMRCVALVISLCGTLCIWWSAPWYQHDEELWALWFASLATVCHVLSLATWFSMLQNIREHTFAAIRYGSVLNVVIMFAATIVWTPEHLKAAYMTRWDNWAIVLIACALASGCKFWVIAMAVDNIRLDCVAIFECVHPIATIATQVVQYGDFFEYSDIIAISCFVFGCILYPKQNI